MLTGRSGLVTTPSPILARLQIGRACLNRIREPPEGGSVDQQRHGERPSKPDLDAVSERQRSPLDRHAIRHMDVDYVAVAGPTTHHAALLASVDVARVPFAPAGTRIPAARKL
jgi:hypothetical protein